MRFEEVVTELLTRPEVHARFVNTLSMLEYIGARKILKSQRAESISMQILSHAAEEIRHAQILKGLALQLSGGKLNDYSEEHLLCGAAARMYFQSLDHACSKIYPDDPKKNYALTTLLIEVRAMRIYPEYEAILKSSGIPNALKSIIKDEDKHLSEMEEELRFDFLLDGHSLREVRVLEEGLFGEFISSVASSIGESNANA